jgi:hypothetical protein
MQNQKMKIPENYKVEIEARIQEQIEAEVAGDVASLYDLILPAIRDKREEERSDEPQLTKNSIAKFLVKVEAAKLDAFRITEYHPTSKIYGSSPAIKVEYSISYNENSKSSLSFIWVKYLEKWYSTSLGKVRV